MRMQQRLDAPEGREQYGRRFATVEPVFSRWYTARFAAGGPRLRRIGIVALARKLLISLWRYLETGLLPEGALGKA